VQVRKVLAGASRVRTPLAEPFGVVVERLMAEEAIQINIVIGCDDTRLRLRVRGFVKEIRVRNLCLRADELDDAVLCAAHTTDHEQIPRSSRRNPLPVEFINRSLLMRHKHLTCALVELRQIGKTPSGSDRILHHPPEAFNGVEVMATMGR
jgi:hypothetical protein